MPYSQVDVLEHDALEVLSLVRSTKNAFAPANRIPPEVLSLIPDYLEDSKDKNLIVLTHVCRSWREAFISRSLLWTYLDFTNVEKTRVYIERSKYAPLEICLGPPYEEEAFLLAIPHIHRLKIISVHGMPDRLLPILAEHFSCPLPLLDELEIDFSYEYNILPHGIFNGDLSSLHKLTLTGVITTLPWRGLSNLTTFNLYQAPKDGILLTQLLDFFESAPCLHHIELHYSLPSSSNAPTERVVPLPHLKELSIEAYQTHSILLNHLSIPAGVSLRLEFVLDGEHPISSYLPESLGCLRNLSHITAANLCFGLGEVEIQLSGPSGMLHIFGEWDCHNTNPRASIFMQFLGELDISRTRWLTVTVYRNLLYDPARFTKSTLYRTLHRMKDLRTLMLNQCEDLPFIHTLNPDKNPSKIVLCPRLEEIILNAYDRDLFHVDELVNMAEERALRGAKLPAITIDINDVLLENEVFRLKKHVSRIKYEFDGVEPEWDTLPS